jgi:hypothetical protein
MFTVIRMQRDDERTWALMPVVLDRIRAFCEAFETETLPAEAEEIVRVWFASGDHRLGLWVVVDAAGRAVGHLLAVPEISGDHYKSTLIRQAYIDAGVDLGPVSKLVFDEVAAWSRQLGIHKVFIVTHREEATLARRWGFTPHKTIMVCHLPERITPPGMPGPRVRAVRGQRSVASHQNAL